MAFASNVTWPPRALGDHTSPWGLAVKILGDRSCSGMQLGEGGGKDPLPRRERAPEISKIAPAKHD